MLYNLTRGKTRYWVLAAQYEDIERVQQLIPVQPTLDALQTMRIIVGIQSVSDPFLQLTGDCRGFEPYIPVRRVPAPWLIYQSKLMTQSDFLKPLIDWNQVEHTAEALKPQINYKSFSCFGDDMLYEIAKFITPPGHAGIIKSVQTSLTFQDNSLEWHRGDPRWMTRILGANVGEVIVNWALTIESLNPTNCNAANHRIIPVTAPGTWTMDLPGVMHEDMPFPWREMLFLWGHDHAVHWRCPSNSVVSLWCMKFLNNGDDGVRDMAGMLKGYIQITNSERTYENFSRGWGYQ
jgi:hypothetical protein